VSHQPIREDDVTMWLKARRDRYRIYHNAGCSGAGLGAVYDALDDLLDEYRLRADLGLDLFEEVDGGC
jgi:hypothetical protein